MIKVTDDKGKVIEEYAYDPWGLRRNPTKWDEADTRKSFLFDRGYTLHEHLDDFGLVNMNGRVYDPLLAQFLSPDPYIQAPGNWLNYNRYAYGMNNPLMLTDPSGEVWWEFAIVGAFLYLKGAHDNRNKETGKWEWNVANWFKEDSPGIVVGVESNTDGSDITVYAGVENFAISYNNQNKFGVGNYDPMRGQSFFAYSSSSSNKKSSYINMTVVNQVANEQRVQDFFPIIGGTTTSVLSEMYYSDKYGTWMGKNFKIYKQTWGGNGYTGGKRKFAKNTSDAIKWGGRAIGVWNAYSINEQRRDGTISDVQWTLEQGSNAYSTLGCIYGAAWGVGWELGRVVTSMEWYQEAKFNFWYNRWESKVGSPSRSNEVLWNHFYKNYKP